MFYLLSGLAIGMILLNSAAAIVVSFMMPLVFSILVGVIPWLEDKGPWIDKNVSMQDFLVADAVVNATDWAHVARRIVVVGLDPTARRHLPGDESEVK